MMEKICAMAKFVLECSEQNLLFLGILCNWLARIGIHCRYSFVTIVSILTRYRQDRFGNERILEKVDEFW